MSIPTPGAVSKSIGATLELQREEFLVRQEQAFTDLRRVQFVNVSNKYYTN